MSNVRAGIDDIPAGIQWWTDRNRVQALVDLRLAS